MEITRTVETATALEKVYAYLSDFTTTTEWDPGTVTTRLVSGDGGVGTVYENTSSFRGRETQLTYVVKERVEDRRFVLAGDNTTLHATDTMTFAAGGTGTVVTYHADFQFKGVLKYLAPLMSPLLAPAFKKLGDDAQQGMQKALDRL